MSVKRCDYCGGSLPNCPKLGVVREARESIVCDRAECRQWADRYDPIRSKKNAA